MQNHISEHSFQTQRLNMIEGQLKPNKIISPAVLEAFSTIARENSFKQYESEQRKLDAGQSDIYKVLERQTALTNARSNELRAQTELNKSIADLQRATGNSLKANNVETRLRK